MKKHNLSTTLFSRVSAVSAGAFIATALLPRAGRADSGINVQNFVPASGSSYVMTENGAAEVPAEAAGGTYRRYTLGVNYNYLDSPLVVTDPGITNRLGTLVSGMQTLDLMAGIEWNGRFSINIDLPLDNVSVPGTQNFAAGDMRLFPKLYLNDHDAPVQFAIIPEVWFPTGNSSLFTTDGGGYGILFAAEHDFGFMSVAANAGYRAFPNAVYLNIDYRQMLPVALGLNIPIVRNLAFNAEGAGAILVPFSNSAQNPSEFYGGLNWRIASGLVATGGGGVDTFNPAASGNFRVQVGLRINPISVDSSPIPSVAPPVAKAEEPKVEAAPPSAPIISERVVYTPKWIYVRDEILFENNSAKLVPASRQLLDEVAEVIKANRHDYKSIVIEGHTNEIGSDAQNMALSQRRADSVKKYLISKGIARKTLKTVGYGKRRPKVTKDSGVSRTTRLVLNRRVQFRVTH